MTNKLLHLHIGRAKVGSTSLQHFLWTNRDLLAQQGVLYPETPMVHSASHKLALVFQPELHDHQHVRGTSAEEVYAAMFDEAARRGLPHIVASSENLFTVDPRKVAKHLPKDRQVKIVCYARRQDEVLLSSYVQELRTGQLVDNIDIDQYAKNPLLLKWLDYRPVLDAWAAEFGSENIVVRVFEKEQMHKGSMTEDFLWMAGIDSAGMAPPERRLNPSPARDILDFIKVINASPEIGRIQKYLMNAVLVRQSEVIGADGRYAPSTLISAALRKEIIGHFQASNAAVARKYLDRKDGVLFKETRIVEPDRSYQGLELDRFAHMAVALFGAQQQRMMNLQLQIDELKRLIDK